MMTVNDENVWNIQARLEFRSQGEDRRETRLKKGQSEGKGRLWRKKEVGRERMMADGSLAARSDASRFSNSISICGRMPLTPSSCAVLCT